MSTNCINCIKNERTGPDLLCDDCRKPTQEAVAKKLNLSSSFFSQLLSCQRNVASFPEAKRISKILKHDDPTIWISGGGSSEDRREACGL